MPKLEAVKGADGAITDVTISYPQDLTTQMLEYSAERAAGAAVTACDAERGYGRRSGRAADTAPQRCVAGARSAERHGGEPGLTAVLAVEDARAPLPEDLRACSRPPDRQPRFSVPRSAPSGRLERPDVITDLRRIYRPAMRRLATRPRPHWRGRAGLKPECPTGQAQAVLDALIAAPPRDPPTARLGHLPYTTVDQFRRPSGNCAAA